MSQIEEKANQLRSLQKQQREVRQSIQVLSPTAESTVELQREYDSLERQIKQLMS